MIEVVGNLWDYPADFKVVTTNGSVNKFGQAVMGRGCAREAATQWPGIAKRLGDLIERKGNRVHFLRPYPLFSFPVKHEWHQRADLVLIRKSLDEFNGHILTSCSYVMPRPGCGNGRLRWDDVRPLMLFLPDNVAVIDFGR